MPVRAKIRSYIKGISINRYRRRKAHALPAGSGFAGEGHFGQFGAGATPQVAHVRTSVGSRLVEADTGNVAGHFGVEGNTEINRTIGSSVYRRGNRRAEDVATAAGTRYA